MPSEKAKYFDCMETTQHYKDRIIERLRLIYEIYKKSSILDFGLIITHEERMRIKHFTDRYSHEILSKAQYDLLNRIFSQQGAAYKIQSLELKKQTISFEIILQSALQSGPSSEYCFNPIIVYGNETEIENYLSNIAQDLKQYCLNLKSSIRIREDEEKREKENRYKQYLKLKNEFEPKENNK